MKQPSRPSLFAGSRRGVTLGELMIVVTILGIIGSMLTTMLSRQQRFHRAVAGIADARAHMRDIATILPTDMRGMSTVGGDVFAIDVNSFQFRAFIGTSIYCDHPSALVVGLPPQKLVKPAGATNQDGLTLTAWINPPAIGDVAFIYNDSTGGGNADDTWSQFTITDTTSAADATWCPVATGFTQAADNGARRYRITLNAAPSANIKAGSPIRFAREVRYSIYQAADNNWYIGYERCVPSGGAAPGTCSGREVLAGAVLPGTTDTLTSGLYFLYYDQDGNRITNVANAASIGRVDIGIRTISESLRRSTGKNVVTGGDSLRFTIGVRNRI